MTREEFTDAMNIVFRRTIDFKNISSEPTCVYIENIISLKVQRKYQEFLYECCTGNLKRDTFNIILLKKRRYKLSYKERQQILVLRAVALAMFWQECLETKAYLNF